MLAGLLGFMSISFPTEVLGSELDIEAVEAVEVSDEEEALDYASEDVTKVAESDDTVEVSTEDEAVDKDGDEDEDWLQVQLTEGGWVIPTVDATKAPDYVKAAGFEFTYQLCVEKEDGTQESLCWFKRNGIDKLEPARFHQKYFGTSGRLFCYIKWYKGDEKKKVFSNSIDYTVPEQRLSSPENVRIIDMAGTKYLEWDEVDGSSGYLVDVFREEYGRDMNIPNEVDGNSFNLREVLDYCGSWKYDIEITANSGDITKKRCSVPATIAYAVSFTLDRDEISLATGDKDTIKPVFSDESVDKTTLTWMTSDPTVASVDQSGNVTAVGPGEADIWAKAPNGTESQNKCKVTVYDQIKSIKLDPSSKTVNTGDEFVLRADVGAYTVTESTIITTTGSTVEVGPAISFQAEDENLTITPYGEGKVLVKAASSIGDNTSVKSSVIVRSTDGSEKEARCSVTINAKDDRVPLKTLGLNATSITLKEKNGFLLNPVYTPVEAGRYVSDLSFDYADEKSKNYITIDEDGYVTAKELPSGVSKATAKVKVTAKDYTDATKEAYCTVTVVNTEVKVTKITLSQKKISMGSNSKVKLTATVAPAWADNTGVNWTLTDESVVDIYPNDESSSVYIVAKKIGTTKLTATSKDGSNKSATCTITVGNPVESVSIKNKEKLEVSMLTVGKSVKLKADVKAASGKAANTQVTWRSDDKSIATVDNNGKVTAKNPGTVTITARSEMDEEGDYKTDSVTLVVIIPVKKIAANGKTSVSAYEGSSGQIQAPIITPVDATYQSISWTSSDNDTLTLDTEETKGENLTFVANKPGKVKITGVTKEKKKITFTVTILGRMHEEDVKLNIKRVPKGLVVDGNNTNNVVVNGLNASKKQSITLTPVLTPKAYNKNVIFTSSNPQVVEVDKKGKIKAVGEGSSRITMTTEDGNYTAICMVTTIKK